MVEFDDFALSMYIGFRKNSNEAVQKHKKYGGILQNLQKEKQKIVQKDCQKYEMAMGGIVFIFVDHTSAQKTRRKSLSSRKRPVLRYK